VKNILKGKARTSFLPSEGGGGTGVAESEDTKRRTDGVEAGAVLSVLSVFRGATPLVDFFEVCFVRGIVEHVDDIKSNH
jgi:hypothetical protein